MQKIEQINHNRVIHDFDERLKPTDIKNILKKNFIVTNSTNPFIINMQ